MKDDARNARLVKLAVAGIFAAVGAACGGATPPIAVPMEVSAVDGGAVVIDPTKRVEPPREVVTRVTDRDKSCCAGKNDCKGKGGCKGDDNSCRGLNDCKGKGTACDTVEEDVFDAPPPAPSPSTFGRHACKGQNPCKGTGGCKSNTNACKGQNPCKGTGGCKTS